MVKCFVSMAEAFEQGWSLVKVRTSPHWHWPTQDTPSPGEEGYNRIKAKIYAGASLERHESIDRWGIPNGHAWNMGGMMRWEAGDKPPRCDFCDATVYHAPVKGNYEFNTCNDFDCTDKALERIGEDGYDDMTEITLERNNGRGGTDHVGHFGGQTWEQW